MRIAIAEFKQESNTFAAVPTTLATFEDFHLWRGDEVVKRMRDTNSEVAGFIDVCENAGHAIVPLLATFAISGAPVTDEAYATLRDELLERLDAARPVEAVLLALHGAMVTEGDDDPDGAFLAAVRERVGPEVPVVVSMDLHANITRRCIDQADAIIGFRTSPHIDQRETGRRAARLLTRWLAGEVRPVMAYAKVPMVTPASPQVHSLPGPFQRLMQAAAAVEDDRVLSASIFTVQPWLDVPEMGAATVAITDGDADLARRIATALAEQTWAERDALMDIDLVPPAEAIRRAMASPSPPVVLSDLADGTGAGSPGDSTAVIAALLEANPAEAAFIWVCDPEVAALAAELGVGSAIDTLVGGKRDHIYNQPVRFTGVVDLARPADYAFSGEGYTGMTMDMGLSAVLRHGNVHLLVTSNPIFTVDPALYRAVGLEPSEARIVVVKSHMQFRAGYDDIAGEIILLDSPGMSPDRLTALDFERIDHPLFPFDTDFTYQPTAIAAAAGRR